MEKSFQNPEPIHDTDDTVIPVLREELDSTLYGFVVGCGDGILSHDVASGLGVDAVEDLTGTLVSRRGLNGRDSHRLQVVGHLEIWFCNY